MSRPAGRPDLRAPAGDVKADADERRKGICPACRKPSSIQMDGGWLPYPLPEEGERIWEENCPMPCVRDNRRGDTFRTDEADLRRLNGSRGLRLPGQMPLGLMRAKTTRTPRKKRKNAWMFKKARNIKGCGAMIIPLADNGKTRNNGLAGGCGNRPCAKPEGMALSGQSALRFREEEEPGPLQREQCLGDARPSELRWSPAGAHRHHDHPY